MNTIPAVGTRVQFAEGTPQFAKCQGIVYVVEEGPDGNPFSVAADGNRPFVWLKIEGGGGRRSGWVSALVEVTS